MGKQLIIFGYINVADPSLHLEMTEAPSYCNTDHEEPSLVSVPESTLSLLEKEARCIAASLDGLTEHLAASLHTVVLYILTFLPIFP